jgi:hypothetical protein
MVLIISGGHGLSDIFFGLYEDLKDDNPINNPIPNV